MLVTPNLTRLSTPTPRSGAISRSGETSTARRQPATTAPHRSSAKNQTVRFSARRVELLDYRLDQDWSTAAQLDRRGLFGGGARQRATAARWFNAFIQYALRA